MTNHTCVSGKQKISFVCMTVFALVFLLGSFIAHYVNPRDPVVAGFPAWDAKYQYLINQYQPVDLMAIGNSHIYRHFSPRAFEDQMKLGGRTISTINMGVPNLSIVELPLLLEAINQKEKKPTYILVDPFVGTGSIENWFTLREIKNHHYRNFIYLSIFDIEHGSGWFKSLAKVGYHFLSFLGNAFNVGMLNNVVYQHQDNYIESNERTPNMINDKGFIAVDYDNSQASQIVSSQTYSDVNKNIKKQITFNQNYIDFFEEVDKRIRLMGSTPIFVATPTMSFKEALRRKAMIEAFLIRQPNSTFLDYSMLFIENEHRNSDIWFDGGHLTLQGATLFSQRLAGDMSKMKE